MIRIQVASTSGSYAEQILSLLRAADAEVREVPIDSVVRTEDPLLLLYGPPEETARQAIAEKRSVADALDEWVRQARTMLDVFRRNRAVAIVLEGAAACRETDSFTRLLRERTGIEIPAQTLESPPEGDPLEQVLAAQWVAETAELSHLRGTLEAASTPLAETPVSPARYAEAAINQYRAEQQKQAEAIAAAEAAAAKHAKEIASLREKLAAAEKAPAPVADDAELADLKEENELLLLQLHQVQEELESYYLQLQDALGNGAASLAREEELYALVRYAGELEKRYLRVLKSRTWKVMSPVREAGRVAKSVVRGKRVPRNALPKRPSSVSRYFPLQGGNDAR